MVIGNAQSAANAIAAPTANVSVPLRGNGYRKFKRQKTYHSHRFDWRWD